MGVISRNEIKKIHGGKGVNPSVVGNKENARRGSSPVVENKENTRRGGGGPLLIVGNKEYETRRGSPLRVVENNDKT